MDAVTAAPSAGTVVSFWLLAVLAVGGALGMLASRKAVHSALWLAQAMVSLALLYVQQDALFLGVVQVVVYTGAVMMLFLFVLMLVGVHTSDSLIETIRGQHVAGVLAGGAFAALLLVGIGRAAIGPVVGLGQANAGGNVQGLAQLVFTRYVWAFEVTGALLITAAVGAMMLAHRERAEPRPTQREMSQARFRGPQPGQLPPPGVYARHNAVDTPALLPDGTPAELSVSKVLEARGVVRPARPAELDRTAPHPARPGQEGE